MAETRFPTSARLSVKTKLALQRMAAREERSEGWIIERALVEYLQRSGDLPKDA